MLLIIAVACKAAKSTKKANESDVPMQSCRSEFHSFADRNDDEDDISSMYQALPGNADGMINHSAGSASLHDGGSLSRPPVSGSESSNYSSVGNALALGGTGSKDQSSYEQLVLDAPDASSIHSGGSLASSNPEYVSDIFALSKTGKDR